MPQMRDVCKVNLRLDVSVEDTVAVHVLNGFEELVHVGLDSIFG